MTSAHLLWNFWHVHGKSGQILVKRDNIFELSVLNQIKFFIERKFGVFLRSLTTKYYKN